MSSEGRPVGGSQQASTARKVILRSGDPAARQALIAEGAYLVADYGAFSLWLNEGRGLGAEMVANDSISLHPEFDRLLLREGTLDTSQDSAGARAQSGPERQLHLVQFIGPVQDEWLEDLLATGAQIVSYVPYNGYVIWADGPARAEIERRVAERVEYQWHGPYVPAFRLASSLRVADAGERVDVVVQVVHHVDVKRTVSEILAQSEAVLVEPHAILNYVNLTVRVPAAMLPALAARPDVFDVEPWRPPRLLDERQGQILAGNLNAEGTQPSGADYLTWLGGLGFPENPARYPIVDVIDDGFDNGIAASPAHADFYRRGSMANASRVAYARDLTPDGNPHGVGGHGTLNLSILGGYNHTTGAAYEDADGYQYGLGISPYGRLASTKVFDDAGNWRYGGSMATLIQGSYRRGARITNSSWGSTNNGYDVFAQAYDTLTRDADSAATGNQEMAHVVSAGNEGPQGNTVGAPGTAKNAVVVGASENYRPSGTDGCGFDGQHADNAQDIAPFSGRGPTADGRVKPDLVAPGTHVQGAASQIAGYDGNGVCDLYWPSGQTLYTWSSGTSHSAPAGAGALSLVHTYLAQGMGGTAAAVPSPAMLKAYLLNSTRYLNGAYAAGETLPSYHQGWGRADLGMAFDGVSRMRQDQSALLTASGQVHQVVGVVTDPGQPFRVTLAWTDAPGSTTGAAWVNDLNLEVTVGGQTYLGNWFDGPASVVGGIADSRNNVESVFLPPGTSGSFVVRVIGANIAGDGVPGNADLTDQDFALVVYNGTQKPDFALGLSPSSAQICRAGEITYTVSVTSLLGYAQSVSLSYSPLPADLGVTLQPSGGIPDYQAALHVSADASATVGTYSLVVTGTGDVTHTASAALDVDAAVPTGLALISPTNGITNVVLQPALTWSDVPEARSYRVQVAANGTFAYPVIDEVITGTVHIPPSELHIDSTYYWRVIAQNGCGSDVSPTWGFRTLNRLNLLYDAVEGGPGQWTTETVEGAAEWTVDRARSYSPTHAWYMISDPNVTDARLTTASAIPLDASSVLTFWHWFDMEATSDIAWDGGVLEISLDGGTWQDLGAYVSSGGYAHRVASGPNPLQNRPAWSGSSGGWRQVGVDLGVFAGKRARIRFRWGGDYSNYREVEGWYVDDVRVTSVRPPFEHKLYFARTRKGTE
jgi:hypothetical protein